MSDVSRRRNGVGNHGARTLDRGLAVLEMLAAAEREMGVTELGERCGLDKSTVHRLLTTLVRRGYARRNPSNRLYSLGMAIFELYDSLQSNLGLQEVCRPFLERLVKISGETAHLAVLSGTDIVFVDWVSTDQLVGVRTVVGRREPAFCTALGKALLSVLSRDEARAVLEQTEMQTFTERTVTDPKTLERDLQRIYEIGYAIDDEEFIAGVRCIAAPVTSLRGKVCGAIGVSGPANRLTPERSQALAPAIRDIAAQASRALG